MFGILSMSYVTRGQLSAEAFQKHKEFNLKNLLFKDLFSRGH